MKNQRKIQIDMFCEDDPRSVAAMLRGKGDGREKLYLIYAFFAKQLDPTLTDLDLTEMYARDSRKPLLIQKLRLTVLLRSVGYQFIGVGATCLTLHQVLKSLVLVD